MVKPAKKVQRFMQSNIAVNSFLPIQRQQRIARK
jgi:hypothetical protein